MRRVGALGLWSSLLWLGLLACGGGDSSSTSGARASQATESVKNWSKDDRIEPLIETCFEKGHFDRDTSDVLPILIDKLQSSRLDVLRNVREELASQGEPAIVELDRLVRRLYTDAFSAPTVINALGVLQLSDAGGSEVAQKLLASCLGHPQETIRSATIRALTRHAQPPIFDDLLAVLAVTQDTTQGDVITALHTADAKRFELQVLAWLEQDQLRGLMPSASQLIAASADAETAERFAPWIAKAKDPVVRAFFAATSDKAANDSGAGLAVLDEMLANEDPQVRANALAALEYTRATDKIAPVLIADPAQPLRMMACSLLGVRIDEPAAHKALKIGLNDADDQVREACLRFLLAAGDPSAVDTALTLLAGSRLEVGIATRALLDRWERNPGLAARVEKLLRTRFEERGAEALSARRYLVQSLAQVPGPSSTNWLLDQSERFQEDTSVGDTSRWFIMQASNTGPAGLEVLREAWRAEDDLERRFDLLWAASFEHDDATREFLLEVLDAERSAPHERLYAAERLAREGPSSIVAPRLKRANLRMDDSVFRPAMECLLWRWYG